MRAELKVKAAPKVKTGSKMKTGPKVKAEPNARREKGRRSVAPRALRPQTARARVEDAMEARLSTLDPDSGRYRVLESAIEFKRSWVHFAKHLVEVRKTGTFKEWGYRTFEAYAQHELHIRRETALKLTRSFDFLSEHERPLLESVESGEPSTTLPHYQALDVLAEARKNPELSERDYREIRDQVFGEDIAPAQVRKMLRERAPEPSRVASEDPSEHVRRCLGLAERLYGMLLEHEDIPDRVSRAVEEAVGCLRRLVED